MSTPETSAPSSPASRILGQSQMAGNIRNFAWNSTPLGPVEGWSESLVSTVNFVLASPVSIILMAGPKLITLYNDAYIPTLAERHPPALGMPGNELWQDAWGAVGHEIESVLATGVSFQGERTLIPVDRNGVRTDTWFTYSFSPVFEARSGSVSGVLCMAEDVTGKA